MAKREFIETREIVYVNAPIAPILQGDSVHYEDIAFKAQIGRIHTFSEQEIVKPYLEKLKEQIAKSADKQLKIAMGTADLNERYAHIRVESAFRQCIAMIDNLLSESDWNASYKGGQEDGKA